MDKMELVTPRKDVLRLAQKRNVDPTAHVAICGFCGAASNAFGSVVHWADCKAGVESIKFVHLKKV